MERGDQNQDWRRKILETTVAVHGNEPFQIQERKTAEQSVLNKKIEAVQLAAENEKEMIQVEMSLLLPKKFIIQ